MNIYYQDVVLTQIESAINFYTIKKYIECITLAGASEEILGKICRDAGIAPSFDSIISIAANISNEHKDAILKVINEPRNSLKHGDFKNMKINNQIEITEFDAYLGLLRVVRNYELLKLPKSNIISKFIFYSANTPLSLSMLDS